MLDARLNFDVYRIYKDCRRKYWPVIITHENFFSTSLRAHFVAMVAALGRVFDNDSRNVSIATLLKTAPQFQQIEAAKLASAEKIWHRNAKKLRHQIVAHHAGKITTESFRRAAITLNDIEQLILECEELVEAWTKHTGSYVQILSGTKTDTLALLDELLKIHEAED